MNLSGIENERYFPAAFFAENLAAELEEAVGEDAAPKAAAKAGADYVAMTARLAALNDPDAVEEARRAATAALLEALGYAYRRDAYEVGGELVPVLARVADADGQDALWVVEAPLAPRGERVDPLALTFDAAQLAEDGAAIATDPIEKVVTAIFSRERPPRYVLVVGLGEWVLARRDRWLDRRVLRFDLLALFSREDGAEPVYWLLARPALVPESGVPLADRLDEEAQRRANAVTASLKATVREAIEILGQEVLDVTGGKYPAGMPREGVWIDGGELTAECLRYMYRLLFLFYAEANPRLGLLDMKDPAYRLGYSLEGLRDLENVRLRTPEEREGRTLWRSLQTTLRLMYEGTGDAPMRIAGLKVALLDPETTPILSRVDLRNEAIQRIIRLLSVERKRGRRAVRISYDRLGIGQLGAVYETLISFTGFVAKEDLIELKPRAGRGAVADDAAEEETPEEADDEAEANDEEADEGPRRTDEVDPLAPTWFVPRTRAKEFSHDEIVYDGPQPRVYPKGSFVYRLAGRDREKTASYYTPEPLARLLVKHALMERCRDMKADEILDLKILEPAMGSAAFLVETTNQLAELYLDRKAQETGLTLSPEERLVERQKVRAFIADRNCFGVDLNPVATELGAISLWLNALHSGEFSPWFGDQLHAGNSLIGARRAAYPAASLAAKRKADLWHQRKPEEIGWRGRRPQGHVWQFLLPAADMAKFDGDKSIAEFAGDAQAAIKEWRKAWLKPLSADEVRRVQRLSAVVDDLFDAVADDLAAARAVMNDPIEIWPGRVMDGEGGDFHAKERALAVLCGEAPMASTLPFKRLKTAMDAWVALWLWPLDKVEDLPPRQVFWAHLELVLAGGFIGDGTAHGGPAAGRAGSSADSWVEPEGEGGELAEDGGGEAQGEFGFVSEEEAERIARTLPSWARDFRVTDVDALVAEVPWLSVAREVAARERPMHFDLVFADVLRARGGFDVIVGNPPWAKPSWNEGAVIGDIDPAFVVRKLSAHDLRQLRSEIVVDPGPPEPVDPSDPKAVAREARRRARTPLGRFLSAYTSAKGAMTVTGSAVMNPFAGGGQNNLYRCFVDLAFRLMAPEGAAALIHQDGHLTDPKAGEFRREWYRRVRWHFEFLNAITSKNFSEIAHYARFSLNVYTPDTSKTQWVQFSSGLLASQVSDSKKHDGVGELPPIKTPEGKWDTRGHRDRIVRIDRTALEAIHALTESADTPVDQTRFLQPYSAKMLDVFRAMAAAPSLDDAVEDWQMRAVWNETAAQKALGVIRRETRFHAEAGELVYSGPIFHVGNPVYKSPKAVCRTKSDYDVVDLSLVPDDYLPRTNYAPAVDMASYRAQLPRCRWDATLTHTDHYRVAIRRMINLNSERSLIPAMLPPGVAHVHTVESLAFKNEAHLLSAMCGMISIPIDFLVKATGKADFHESSAAGLPFVDPGPTAKHRALRLACLTTHYADLWNRHAHTLTPFGWSSADPRLPEPKGPDTWDRSAALRSDFARRMALVEIDVLVARALGLTLDQLVDIYRIYFPVLQQNEAATWYDANGRIVWTASKGLPGVGYLENGKRPGRAAWEAILAREPERLTCEATIDFLPGGPRTVTREFIAPFDRCDRIADYRRAWAHFDSLETPRGTA